MTLEDLADLIRANGANTNLRVDGLRGVMIERTGALIERITELAEDTHRRIDEHRNETNAQYMALHSNIEEIRHALSVANTVVEMRKRIEALEAEVARLGWSA